MINDSGDNFLGILLRLSEDSEKLQHCVDAIYGGDCQSMDVEKDRSF